MQNVFDLLMGKKIGGENSSSGGKRREVISIL